MNQLYGKIHHIVPSDSFSLVEVTLPGGKIDVILITPPEKTTLLEEDLNVWVLFKETEVAIGKNLSGKLSLTNRLSCTVRSVEKGTLLAQVVLDFGKQQLAAVIPVAAAADLALQSGDEVEALLPAHDLLLIAD